MTVNKNKKNDRGFAAILILVILISLVLVMAFSLGAVIITKNKISKTLLSSFQSYYSAESGIEDGLLRIIKNYNYTAVNSFALGGASINQSITQNGGTTTIESLSSYANNERKVKTELTVNKDDISFHYGVQVGQGGLTMGNNASVVGNIYSDGTIIGGGGASITGDVFVATGMALDGFWDTYSSDKRFAKDGDVAVDVAMSFSPSFSGDLSQVSFYIKKDNSPADGTIRIVEDNAGSPSTAQIASATLIVSKIGTSYGWVEFSFSSPASLTAGNTYWIIIDVSTSNSKYFYIGSAPGNSNSVSKYSLDWSSGSWTLDTVDYEYRAYVGGVATSLNTIDIGGNAHAHEILDCNIVGDAYYQSISGSTVGGTSYPGSPDPAVEALPISDSNIADWKNDAASYGTLDSSICTQPASITINGGVLECDFAPVAGITITLNGTLWVKGNITLGNGTNLVLGSGYGANSGVIIADNPGSESTSGKILADNNVVICGSQGLDGSVCFPSNGTYILMLSTHSGAATYAVDIRNNADGAIFYAHNGTANINNNASLKEVTAYKLNLANNATVTYESGLANASFTSGPGGGWTINSWNEVQ